MDSKKIINLILVKNIYELVYRNLKLKFLRYFFFGELEHYFVFEKKN